MKTALMIIVICLVSFEIYGQDLEVTGRAKVIQMDKVNATDSVVVRLPDGTLAVRDVSTIHGADGIHCWDTNMNGLPDVVEDVNNDGVIDVNDCKGPIGDPGEDGNMGADGINCWDMNMNGLPDVAEDLNNDGVIDVNDCKGMDGIDGSDGMDGNDGTDGSNGTNCWDLNNNGVGDPNEDLNSDSVIDVLDCQGAEGPAGEGVPSGTIAMWSGTLATIPNGWALCDGQNGTPDLSGKFVYGVMTAVEPGSTGGAVSHSHASNPTGIHSHGGTTGPSNNSFSISNSNSNLEGVPVFHTHNIGADGNHNHGINLSNHLPPYYELAFIMKL